MRVPDREKQRRLYLAKKMEAVSKGTGAGLLCIVLLLITCLLGVMTFVNCANTQVENGVLIAFISILATASSGVLTFVSGRYVKKQADTVSHLPFVPPVTPHTLPAEEVLVRGAQEPTQEQSKVLLRVADESAKVPAGELLRASLGEMGE